MSEYQYVGFRAIEKPVSEKNLEYMHSQSSSAEITPWSFDKRFPPGQRMTRIGQCPSWKQQRMRF